MNKFIFAALLSFFSLYGCAREKIEINNDLQEVPAAENISSSEAYELINQNHDNSGFVIIDVRTKREYEAGHIENSLLIDIGGADFNKEIDGLHREKTYLVYCAVGGRSRSAMRIMEGKGFSRVYNMSGGVNSWRREGFNLEN